ncbi:MAG: hypothetical protein AAFY45_09550 [Bacteroidota bacterium]
MYRSILFLLAIVFSLHIQAQEIDKSKSNYGLFISSKNFSYSEDFYKEISQFLTIDDDRSWVGKMKQEFIIRMGWLLQEQIQKLEKADTLYFLNAEPALGRAFLDTYNFETFRYTNSSSEFEGLKKIYVLNSFEIDMRKHRSVYIRSNKMYTEYIPIMILSFNMGIVDLENGGKTIQTEVCFDAQKSTTNAKYFDLYSNRSEVGKLLSKSYSQWWSQVLNGIPSNCVE